MARGLNVGRLVRVDVNMSPLAAARRGFGTLLVLSDETAISGAERYRGYATVDDVSADFGVQSEVYKAAVAYFGQSPRPRQLFVGRMVATAEGAALRGGPLSATELDPQTWAAIANGSASVEIDGVEKKLSALDFSSVTNLNAVATVLQTAVGAGAKVVFDGERFVVQSASTGSSSAIGYFKAVTPASGTDISALLRLTASTATGMTAAIAAESALEAVQACMNASGAWYGLAFALTAANKLDVAKSIVIAQTIEAATPARIVGFGNEDARTLDKTYTTDVSAAAKAAKLHRTMSQYSPNPYAICSLFGRMFSVNFSANRSVITLMYKQEPGVTALTLTTDQANTLKDKNCNVFVNYDNDTAIIQYGKMADGAYIDEVHGLDWFADAVQNAVWNTLYQSKTKIPQTAPGQNELLAAVSAVCYEAVENGLVAPGVWNSDGFGQLSRGDYLKSGFYLYTQSVDDQDQSIREQRIAPPIQIAVKLAGAFHEADIIVSVNR